MRRNKNQNLTKLSKTGFTIIELLVVVAIISLLTSIALIAFQSARAKSRNVKRLSDMTQMNTGLELYFAANKGYPPSASGTPVGLQPQFSATIPVAPVPPDGLCSGAAHSASCVAADPGCATALANDYYYVPQGTPYLSDINGVMVYPSYSYYFCLGDETGNFPAGERILTPVGVR